MTTYRVTYKDTVTYEVHVEADTAAEARRLVRELDGTIGESLPIMYGNPRVQTVERVDDAR